MEMQANAAERIIVKVRYYSAKEQTTSGNEYTYFSEVPLALGEIVHVPVRDSTRKAVVTTIGITESQVQSYAHLIKTIPAPASVPAPAVMDPGPDPLDEPAATIDTTDVPSPPEPAAAPPQKTINCPPDCAFGVNPSGPWDNPSDGGCMKEDELAELDGNFEPDPTAPMCPGYQPEALDEIATGTFATGSEYPTPERKAEIEALQSSPPEPPQEEEPAETLPVSIQFRDIAVEAGIFGSLFQHYQEAAGLLQFAKTRVIATNEDLKPATNDLAIIATCKKAMTARKDEIVGPLKAELKLINEAFDDLMFPVLEADRLTRAQVMDFDNEQRRLAAEAARIEGEKFRLAQEEAALNEGETTVNLDLVPAPPPVPERVRTGMGTMGGRDNWKARVLDFKLLDDRFKLPNEQMLNALARSSKGTAVEPGVEFYNERSVTMRTKAG